MKQCDEGVSEEDGDDVGGGGGGHDGHGEGAQDAEAGHIDEGGEAAEKEIGDEFAVADKESFDFLHGGKPPFME